MIIWKSGLIYPKINTICVFFTKKVKSLIKLGFFFFLILLKRDFEEVVLEIKKKVFVAKWPYFLTYLKKYL